MNDYNWKSIGCFVFVALSVGFTLKVKMSYFGFQTTPSVFYGVFFGLDVSGVS